MLFVAHLVKEKKQSSTVKCYLSAIRATLKNEGIELRENLYLLNSLTRACKLENDCLVQRHPIGRSMMKKLLDQLQIMYHDQPYLASLYTSLFITTYTGLFRIGEVTESPHIIKACDVEIATNKKKLKFTLWTSKTHNRGNKPQIIKIKSEPCSTNQVVVEEEAGRKTNGKWCPFQCLRHYLKLRKDTCKWKDEQFFVFSDHSPVTPSHFREVLKESLQQAGYDSSKFTVHGMRGGRALELLKLGVSVETIKKIGRWKSNAVFTYLKQW